MVKDDGGSGLVAAWGHMGVSILGLCFDSPLSSGGFRLNGVSALFVWLVPLSAAFGGGDCSAPFQLLFQFTRYAAVPRPLLVVVGGFVESLLVSFGGGLHTFRRYRSVLFAYHVSMWHCVRFWCSWSLDLD
ncbi:hypothetical protein L484_020542 [Morus notabilis]|uniref:Uncharacterized protein n=1 Tax=Morus notabilis TaxID=981085 RepID=W9SBB3_9ROSA|nr:hypothetical protein L484_020542 [Morus notabilis]